MSSHQLDEEAIFHIARGLSDGDLRTSYLDQICAGDQALRDRVEALLAAHDQESAFLKSSPEAKPTSEFTPVTEAPGQQIGRFKLLQKIGEGGFGVVYMAEQVRPVRRKVALKVIKPGMDTHAVVARFEAERQALALMDHPNIARVLDGGATESGRPYFVMELVRGVPITEYCDKNNLSTRDRLELFITVCQAVQHAHQKGIIHRDLKPSNILITLHDGKPVVKVIDFGVAKAINQQLTEKTLFTAYGQMVGTPQYMSPEQAEMSGLDVDTRSDIYSLGVLLYKLLTGTTPFGGERLRTAGYAEMQRIIQEEEPPRPSVRLSSAGEKLTVIAKHRSVSPELLSSLIEGDLDWIAMRALEKDRSHRYSTATALADDIKRFLQDQPVEACPPSAGYRLRKFARRNKLALAAATVVALTLMVASFTSLALAIWAFEEQKTAKIEKSSAETQRRIAEEARKDADDQAMVLRRRNYASAMSESLQAWAVGNLPRASQLLKRAETLNLRGKSSIEGRLLQALLVESQPADTWGHSYDSRVSITDLNHKDDSATPTKLAFSHDDRFLAFGLANGGLIVRALGTNRDWELIESKPDEITHCVAFSPDGHYLLAGRGGPELGQVRIWKLPQGSDAEFKEIVPSVDHSEPVCSVAISHSANGSLAASVDLSGNVKVWGLPYAENVWELSRDGSSERQRLQTEPSAKRQVTFAANGELLIVRDDGTVSLWDTRTRVVRAEIIHDEAETFDLSVSPQGIVAWPSELCVRLWDVSGQEVRRIPVPVCWDRCFAVAFSRDGHLLATGSMGSKPLIRLWETSTWREVGTFVNNGSTSSIAFSNDDKWLAATTGGMMKLWKVSTARRRTLFTHDDAANWLPALAVSPDGRSVACKGESHTVVIWDTVSGTTRDLGKSDGHTDTVLAVAFSPDGKKLASAARDRTVRIWNVESSKCEKVLDDHRQPVFAVAFSNEGTKFASAGMGGELKLWDTRAWRHISVAGHADNACVCSVRFSSNGKYLATGTVWSAPFSDQAAMWDISGAKPSRINHFETWVVSSLDFSPDNRSFAAGCNDSTLIVRDVVSFHEQHVLNGIGTWMTGIAFHPHIGSRELVTTTASGEISIWDLNYTEAMATLRIPDRIRKVEFFPDGHAFVTASMDGYIRVWPLE